MCHLSCLSTGGTEPGSVRRTWDERDDEQRTAVVTEPIDEERDWPGDASACAAGRRRRGPALLNAIYSAALSQLAEHGLGALTMEGVAAAARTGKASLYRRWSCKEDLVLDALGCTMPNEPDIEHSSGRLRDDLLFGFGQMARFISGPGGAIVRNLVSSAEPGQPLMEMARSRLIEPRLERLCRLMEGAVQRGEARSGSVTAAVAQVGPAVVLHRFLLYGQVTDEDVRDIVDEIVLPLLRHAPDGSPAP